VAWGWFPAFVWVVLGTVFMGAVHDYGALAISARNGGTTVGELTGRVIGPRVRIAFLSILVILAWVVLAVTFAIVVAMVMGWLYYKKGFKLLIPSVIAVGLLYLMIYIGQEHIDPHYLTMPGLFGADGSWFVDGRLGVGADSVANPDAGDAFLPPLAVWILLLLVYAFVASVLPVFEWDQPACTSVVGWAEGILHPGDTLVVHTADADGNPGVVAPVVLGARPKEISRNWFLGLLSLFIALLDVWIIAEAAIVLRKVFAERKATPDADLSGGLQ